MAPEQLDKRLRKKKRDDEMNFEAHHHDESNWLVSYADMMTLLFCFFVLMYSLSKIDNQKFDVVRKEVAKYFGGKVKEDAAVQKVKSEVKNAIDEAGVGDVNIVSADGKLQLRFQGAVLFESGSAFLKPQMVPLITKIVGLVRQQARVEEIRVEGHTDSDPIYSQVYPSNWELSSARAATIVRAFLTGGFSPSQMVAEGYADSKPMFPEFDAKGNKIVANQAQNRRVLINISFGADPVAARNALVTKQFAAPNMPGQDKVAPAAAVEQAAQDAAASAAAGAPGAGVGAAGNPATEILPEGMTPEQAYQERLRIAQERLKEAEKREKELRELEKLNKKIADLEQKARDKERTVVGPAAAPAQPAQPVMNIQQGLAELQKRAEADRAARARAQQQQRKPAAASKPPAKPPVVLPGKKGVAPPTRKPSSATPTAKPVAKPSSTPAKPAAPTAAKSSTSPAKK